ncbi:ABC transporter permease [Segetibacter aerophilus]|uniref:ABC transporter permease n=1 Tax=Segetibacter aerophilus TaxID=670293 RepID=UPI0011BE3639|nr:ABC transporter permease [Segetibacter aerophilus]
MSLLISLRSEVFKTKRTVSLYFTLAAAAFGPLMSMLDLIFDGVDKDHQKDIFNEMFTTKFQMTSAVVLPMFIILICTLLPQIEYKNNTWKQVLASPQLKPNVFFAKFVNIQLLIFLFIVTNQLLMFADAVILHFMEPSLHVLNQPLNVSAMFATLANGYVALLAMSAIHFWLGIRYKNFIIPVAIGIAFWFIGSILVMQTKLLFTEYFPYSFHMFVSFKEFQLKHLNTIRFTSVAYTLLFLFIGFRDFRKKSMN